MTRGAGREHIVRATLESIAYQARDVVECVGADSGISLEVLRVDGGACQNDFLMQFQADILGTEVERPPLLEVTALGAAVLAGLQVGFWRDREDLESASAAVETFSPKMSTDQREELYAGWKRAVERSRDWAEDEA